ncbi:MAG: hypothetical protein AAF937_07260 [Planctomycetota bacterium]
MERDGKPNETGSSKARCVVWAKSEPPAALMGAMRRKGVEPRVTPDAFRAMAEVVRGGSLAKAKSILVLVEPSELRGKRAMLTSCRRYAPKLRVWVYQAKASMQLRPLELASLVPEPKTVEADHTFGGDPAQNGPEPRPTLRLVESQTPPRPTRRPGIRAAHLSGESQNGESRVQAWRNQDSLPGASAAARASDNPSGYRPSGLLTDEELAMLLADDPDDRKKR